MHSSASRAIDGTNSVKRVCEEPNLVFISQARNEPNASAANSGTVIMDCCGASGISDDSVPTAVSHPCRCQKREEKARVDPLAKVREYLSPDAPTTSVHDHS